MSDHRAGELARLKEVALDDGAPILERADAVMDRMRLVDDILGETLEVTQSREDAGQC